MPKPATTEQQMVELNFYISWLYIISMKEFPVCVLYSPAHPYIDCYYWLVVKSCPTLLWPHELSRACQEPAELFCPWNFPSKNTAVGCHFLLQGIFLTQGSNPCPFHWQADSLPLNHLGSTLTLITSMQIITRDESSEGSEHSPQRNNKAML